MFFSAIIQSSLILLWFVEQESTCADSCWASSDDWWEPNEEDTTKRTWRISVFELIKADGHLPIADWVGLDV